MIGIICAMEKEAQAVLKNVDFISRRVANGSSIVVGRIGGRDCVVATTGIGKVNAAMRTQYVLDKYDIDFIMNIGVCGGKKDLVELGKVYLVDKCAQYDFDISEIDDVPKGYIEKVGVFIDTFGYRAKRLSASYEKACLVTGDKFTSSQEIVDFVEENFQAGLRDMEGAAVAQVCFLNGVECVLLKGVTDFVGPDSCNMYPVNCPKLLTLFSREMPVIISEVCK